MGIKEERPDEPRSVVRYILKEVYSFRGWKLLPFAIQHKYIPKTEFFLPDSYKLLEACDGQTDIVWDSLKEEERKEYERWEKNGIIHRAGPGEVLQPYQYYRYYDARFKDSVHWSITGRCNFKCRHCFMSAPHAAQGEPTWEQLMTMLDAFERCGIRHFGLTGGEPMLRKDFWDLVDEMLRREMIIDTLYSNGMLITDEFLDKMEERKMRSVIQFSFDGVDHHDWMRGVPGAEKMVIDALGRCRERGIHTTVSMVLCRESKGSIRESVNLLASLGVSHVKVGNASPQGEWLNEPEHFLSRAETFEAFMDYIPHYFEDGMPVSIGLDGFFSYDKSDNRPYAIFEKNVAESQFPKAMMCGQTRWDMYVSPQGKVLPCMSMVGGPIEQQFPNMLETPLEDILDKDSLYLAIVSSTVADFMENNPDCKDCEYRCLCCGGCRAKAVESHPTEYLSKDLITCEYFKGGWKEKKEAMLRKIGAL